VCVCVCVCVCVLREMRVYVEAKEEEVLEIGRNAGGTEVISATERMKIE
jgi:hypothetical protein